MFDSFKRLIQPIPETPAGAVFSVNP